MLLTQRDVSPRFSDGYRDCDLDGRHAVRVECGGLDILAMEPWRRQSLVCAFEELLRSLETDLHIAIHVRQLSSASAGFNALAGADRLNSAVRTHWAHRLDTEAVFDRRILLTSIGDEPSVRRQSQRMTALLSAAGASWRDVSVADSRHPAVELCDSAAMESWSQTPTELRVGDVLLRALELHRLPGVSVEAGWLAPLLRVEACCDIGIRFVPEDPGRAMRRLSRRMRDLGAHRMLEADREVVPDANVTVGFEAASRLRDRLAAQAGRPLSLSISAIARATSLDDLEVCAGRLRNAFASALAAARPAHLDHRRAVLSSWGWSTSRRPGKLVDSQSASTCVPWLASGLDDGDGYVLGATTRGRAPVRLQPFDEQLHSNANIGIFAASGQGKSFLIGGLVLEARRQNSDVILVDPEGEYRGLVEAIGGSFVDLVTEAPINPFDLGDTVSDRSSAVVDVCAELCGGLTDVERAFVDASASAACATNTAPLLRDCLPLLEGSAPRVAAVVRRFVDGPLQGLLDRPTAPLWDQPLLAIGHREVRDELVPITTHLLGLQLWRMVRGKPRRRHVILDEVGMLAAHPPLRRLLALLARRCRKYGSGLVVATQNLQDLLHTEDGQVVAGNCAITFCGGHRAHEAQLMERAFGLTEEQRRSVERAPRGEFLLLAGQRRAAMRVDLPGLYGDLIRSR